MPDNKFDFSNTFDIISKVFTILIPIVLFYFGNEFKEAQDDDNKQQQNFNRITILLKSLSSENPLERKLAIQFSKDLATSGNFPTELLSVMDEISSTDTANSKEAGNVLDLVNQKAISDKNADVEQQIKQVVENSPTRVYMQVVKGFYMPKAKQLLNKLKQDGYNMLGIEIVDLDKSPSKSEVRYFKVADSSQAVKIAESINKGSDFSVITNHIKGYENKRV